ncbi:MAG TPA: cation-transporting P-type ATPase [Candidatus Limnocylindrales bacterium]|nr:cation-transporting P-type ATPase [Candidatus Limnocylindrales bacterium]
MEIFRLTVPEAFKQLKSQPGGLSFQEARQRLKDFGFNALHEEKGLSPLWLLGKQFTHFFALLLGVGAGLAFMGEVIRPGEGMGTLGWAILGVIVINAVFAFWEEYRAEKAIQALKKLLPNQVRVRRGGEVISIDAIQVVPGDIMLLEEGDKIPADGRVLISNLLTVNNAALTGESLPLSREVEDPEATDPLRAKNMVFAGTYVVSGNGEALVTATGVNTEFGKIAKLTVCIKQDLSPFQKEISKVSQWIAVLAVTMGVLFFWIGMAMGRDIFSTVLFALGIIVANIPEGLLPTVTLALSMASFRLAKQNALVKDLNSVETLASTTVICTDKTGTLTQNRMTVQKVFCNNRALKLTDEGVEELRDHSSEQTREALTRLLEAAVLNVRVTLKGEEVLGDPTETALLQAFLRWGNRNQESLTPREKIGELPFSGERKQMSTLYREAGEIILYTKGAPEVILEHSTQIWSDGIIRPLEDTDRKKIQEAIQAFAQEALRVLGIAYRRLATLASYRKDNPGSSFLTHKVIPANDLERDLVFLGLVGLADPPREGVIEAVNQCHRAGIRVIMVTGDNPATGMAIGRQIGLEKPDKPLIPIHSEDMAQMSDESLKEILRTQNPLFARLTSRDKLRIVSLLKELGEVVAVTGDGVNDAPALKRADIGIAMGLSGTQVAKEAANMVLVDDHFQTIVKAIEEGRTVYFNIKKFMTYILASNVPEILPYLAFFLFRIPLGLTIIQILSIDLGTDMLPALALGAERKEPYVMLRPPIGPQERLLDRQVVCRGFLFLGLIEGIGALVVFLSYLSLHGWQYGQELAFNDPLYQQATTMTLLSVITTQVANGLTLRSWQASPWQLGFWSNHLLLWGIGLELVLGILFMYFPPLQRILGTAPIDLKYGWLLLPFPFLLFVLHEGLKGLIRKNKDFYFKPV